jgi:hypothetical protein
MPYSDARWDGIVVRLTEGRRVFASNLQIGIAVHGTAPRVGLGRLRIMPVAFYPAMRAGTLSFEQLSTPV